MALRLRPLRSWLTRRCDQIRDLYRLTRFLRLTSYLQVAPSTNPKKSAFRSTPWQTFQSATRPKYPKKAVSSVRDLGLMARLNLHPSRSTLRRTTSNYTSYSMVASMPGPPPIHPGSIATPITTICTTITRPTTALQPLTQPLQSLTQTSYL